MGCFMRTRIETRAYEIVESQVLFRQSRVRIIYSFSCGGRICGGYPDKVYHR